MKYSYSTLVKNNDLIRNSFQELTRQTFGFDFVDWYESGHWGELHIPHVLLDGEKVISNVSVNLMQFDICGQKKSYVQLGTVMTDLKYRGQGLNRWLMEQILQECKGKVDGIYLFANDSVLDYYPKFGFKSSKEYEYYMDCDHIKHVNPYRFEIVDMSQNEQSERVYDVIRNYSSQGDSQNQNDGMYMSENIGLYQFWLAAEYGNNLYYLPENDIYVVANVEGQVLHIQQIFGKQPIEMERLVKTFGQDIHEAVLGYTPIKKEQFLVREHKEEDCTLFILGEDLQCIERNKMIFPVLSHA